MLAAITARRMARDASFLPDQLTAGFQEPSARTMLLKRNAHDLRGSFLHGLLPPGVHSLIGAPARRDARRWTGHVLAVANQVGGDRPVSM